jgi:GDPmannose 4,6-dehydratase
MTDGTSDSRLIQEIKPDEIYNLAAMSHVAVSFETPEYTGNRWFGNFTYFRCSPFVGIRRKKTAYKDFAQLYGSTKYLQKQLHFIKLSLCCGNVCGSG